MNETFSPKIVYLYCPIFIILYNLTGNLSNDIYLPTLPALAQEFGITSVLSQLSMTVWFAGVALPQIYFGLVADRIGYRPLMLWGSILFLCATFCCYIAPNIYVLLIGRFLQGVGVSSLNIATFATIRSRYYDEKFSIKFISWVNVSGSLAPLAGPVIGSFLFHFFGWRSTFLCILVLGFLSFCGLYHFMLEGSDFQNKNVPMNVTHALLYYKQVLTKKLIIPVLTYTSFLGALIAYLTTAPFIIHNFFKIPIKFFGLTQLLPFSCFIIGGLMVNKFVNSFKLTTIISAGLALSMFGVLSFLGFIIWPSLVTIYSYLGVVSLFLFSFAFIGSPLMSLALSSSHNKGGSAALLGLSMALMASFASLLTALFYNGHFYMFSLIMALFMSFGILNYLFFIGFEYNEQK
ncbi:MAG: MFS transporter [Legionella sp.]|nr:MFS transporter [Legionella sp.]